MDSRILQDNFIFTFTFRFTSINIILACNGAMFTQKTQRNAQCVARSTPIQKICPSTFSNVPPAGTWQLCPQASRNRPVKFVVWNSLMLQLIKSTWRIIGTAVEESKNQWFVSIDSRNSCYFLWEKYRLGWKRSTSWFFVGS